MLNSQHGGDTTNLYYRPTSKTQHGVVCNSAEFSFYCQSNSLRVSLDSGWLQISLVEFSTLIVLTELNPSVMLRQLNLWSFSMRVIHSWPDIDIQPPWLFVSHAGCMHIGREWIIIIIIRKWKHNFSLSLDPCRWRFNHPPHYVLFIGSPTAAQRWKFCHHSGWVKLWSYRSNAIRLILKFIVRDGLKCPLLKRDLQLKYKLFWMLLIVNALGRF